MTAFAFNAKPLLLGARHEPPLEGDFPATGFRRSSLAFVRERATPYVRRVLDSIPVSGSRRFVLVDVRVDRIQRGRAPGRGGWHTDAVNDPSHASPPEIHHLFVTGSASLTEFVSEPISLEVAPGLSPEAFRGLLASHEALLSCKTTAVPSSQVVTYGRLDVHRAAKGLASELRLLVRVTESDVLRPDDRLRPNA